MTKLIKVFWLLSLTFFVGGCSTYRTASFPRTDTEWTNTVLEETVIQEGDKVRVTLIDSSVVSGRVIEVTPNFLTLDPSVTPENEMSPFGIMTDQISNIEFIETDLGKSILLTVGVVALCGAIGSAIYIGSAFSGGMYGN